MRLVERMNRKRNRRKKAGPVHRWENRDLCGSGGTDGVMIRGAQLMHEAAENYRLAPVAVRRYYISLYRGLLEKFGEELKESGLLDVSAGRYAGISLYRDAGMDFENLSRGLILLAGKQRKKSGKMMWF